MINYKIVKMHISSFILSLVFIWKITSNRKKWEFDTPYFLIATKTLKIASIVKLQPSLTWLVSIINHYIFTLRSSNDGVQVNTVHIPHIMLKNKFNK